MTLDPIDAIITEVEAAIPLLALPREGLDDFQSLDLTNESQSVITEQMHLFDQRLALLQSVLSTAHQLHDEITALLADGYPVPPTSPAERDVMEDLRAQLTSQNAALSSFVEAPPTTEVMGEVGPERETVVPDGGTA